MATPATKINLKPQSESSAQREGDKLREKRRKPSTQGASSAGNYFENHKMAAIVETKCVRWMSQLQNHVRRCCSYCRKTKQPFRQ